MDHPLMSVGRAALLAGLCTSLLACGVPQSEFDQLKAENERLKAQVDELQNGEERLVAEIDQAYSQKNFALAKSKIEQLRDRHPDAKKNAEYRALAGEIEQAQAAQELKAKKEREEAERLANLNNTGIWTVRYYVDNFNEPTKEPYITNPQIIAGTFSNTATQDSPLHVKFLIDSAESIDIQLYEYAGNNPVKAGVHDVYTVLVRDKDGERLELRATNYGDRLSLEKRDAKKLHAALMKGGRVQFRIVNRETTTSQYVFAVDDASYYENAVAKLELMRAGKKT
jgi:outer membrane murein-binding lipoprotein Lpp